MRRFFLDSTAGVLSFALFPLLFLSLLVSIILALCLHAGKLLSCRAALAGVAGTFPALLSFGRGPGAAFVIAAEFIKNRAGYPDLLGRGGMPVHLF